MEKVLYDINGKEAGKVKLNEKLFGMEIRAHLIHEKIKNELANRRVGTACTKTRGEVSGGGIKPFRQKGTGRARQGSSRSPVQVGGGTVFGPKPRDYSYSLPKKLKKLAMATTVAYKFQEDEVVKIVKDFNVDSGKTKDAFQILKALNLGVEERTLVIYNDDQEMLKRSLRNIPWVKFMSAKRLAAHELFYAKHVHVMESALKYIDENYQDVVKNK